jgi:dystrophin
MSSDSSQIQTCLTLWTNHHLARHSSGHNRVVTDLLYDLRDGEILLLLLESLDPPLTLPRERGGLVVHKLANIATALGHLQKERVRLEGDEVTPHKILQGDTVPTIQVVWAIAFHWQCEVVVTSLKLPPLVSSPNIESLVVAWARTISPGVTNLTTDWSDGLLVARMVLSCRPGLVGLAAALDSDQKNKAENFIKLIHQYLSIPPLLSLPTIPDKRVTMLYMMCLAQVLEPQITPDSLASLPNAPDPEFSCSPSKTPVRMVKVAQVVTLPGWANILEEVLSWLLEAEDHLLSLHSLGQKHLETVKTRFYNHEDFMLELKSHQGAVGEVLTQGTKLSSSGLQSQQLEDVRLQMKLLNDRWEKVRELAMNKQAELHQLVMKLQVEQMTELKGWMTAAENRLAASAEIGQTKEQVAAHLAEHEILLRDLESQQAIVSSISNFILVDSEDTSELEDSLTALGERWVTLCRMCEEKYNRLQQLDTRWKQLGSEKQKLESWLCEVERSLREMERNLGVDTAQLLEQVKQVMDHAPHL